MSFRSTLCRRESVRALVLPAALAAGLLVGAPGHLLAGNPQPNPFTGRYNCPELIEQTFLTHELTISDRGRIEDPSGVISGRVWSDGFMQLTLPLGGIGVPGGRGGGGSSTITYEGLADLDEDGNLYAFLVWENRYGAVLFLEIFWLRCD